MTTGSNGGGLWTALRRWIAGRVPHAARPRRAAEDASWHLAANLPSECVSVVLRDRREGRE